jgi:hypothetical protein
VQLLCSCSAVRADKQLHLAMAQPSSSSLAVWLGANGLCELEQVPLKGGGERRRAGGGGGGGEGGG